jgi:flagellar motor switch protein FliN/FliY
VTIPTSTPYEWLRKIPSVFAQLDEIPLLGRCPPFPLDKVISLVTKTLNLKQLHVQLFDFEWRTKENLFSGLGDSLMPLNIFFPRIEGTVFWVMAEKDIVGLMSQILLEGKELLASLDKDYQAGFYRFLAIEVLDAIQKASWDSKLTPQLLGSTDLPDDVMLSFDISVELQNEKSLGRIFFPSALQKSIKKHFLTQASKDLYISPLSHKLQLTVHLEVGSTAISAREWSTVNLGDFLILDQCSILPGEEKGRVMLTIEGHPFFRGKIKDGNIKILEHPLYYEVNMKSPTPEDEEEEFEDEEEEIEEDEYEEEDEEIEEDEDDDEDEDEDDDEDDDEDEDEDEEKETLVQAVKNSVKQESKATSPNDIPLSMVIEVGRLKMTVQTLLDMKPGNLLELNIHPENGVDLVINGSRVGKGELLQIGEVLGVRVLEIG